MKTTRIVILALLTPLLPLSGYSRIRYATKPPSIAAFSSVAKDKRPPKRGKIRGIEGFLCQKKACFLHKNGKNRELTLLVSEQ
jgi:hypothetical protein